MANKNTSIYKIFSSISCCLWASHVAAVDVLNQGDVLSYSSSLVSRNELFTLRFFNLSRNGTNYSYLGMFYRDYTDGKPFWIANRDGLVTDNSEALVIDENGKLMITFNGSKARWELFSGQSNNKVTAILQDDGNFVLKSGEQILWQSFDFPTDSFLPEMKLGINHKAGQNLSLTSWFTASMPIPGAFTLEWIERQLVVKRRGVKYWTSGELNNGRFKNLEIFAGGEIDSNFTNLHEEYLLFKIVPKGNAPPFPGLVIETTSLSLEYDGTIVERRIQGGLTNRIYKSCDGNNTDSGCERWKRPKCRRHGEKFQKKEVIYDNAVPHSYYRNKSLSFSDCLDICWKNCSCFGTGTSNPKNVGTGTVTDGFTIVNSDTPGCLFWYGPLKENENGESGGTVYHMIIPGPPEKKTWVGILIVVATTLIVILLGILVFMRWRRARFEEKFLLELMNEAKEIEIDGKKGFKLKVYSVSSIMDATNCFSDENKLGEGGYGPVYEGLFDGQEIAIKRLSRSSRQGLAEFKNELIIVAKLQHTNLVQLLGFCIQGEDKMLVYEFMPQNSLDSYIFDQSKRKLFDWNKYFNIIEEIAQAILYLHKYSRLQIIHRDLKSGNILLDNNMNPKISDFGMARIFTTIQSEANTNRIVGTRGYMAPEYAVMGILSTKSDVFSYGVLVLEIVSGRRSNSNFNFDRPLNLIGYAWMLWKEDAALELMHPTLRDSCSEDKVLRCINVALLCVEDNPLDRPSMADVISMLTSEGVELPMPKQPAFCIERRVAEVNSSTGGMAENHTINNLTMSVMTGR